MEPTLKPTPEEFGSKSTCHNNLILLKPRRGIEPPNLRITKAKKEKYITP